MPVPVTNSSVADITTFYLETFEKDWTDAVRPYQNHMVARELFTKRRIKGAPSERNTFNLKVKQSGNTKSSSLFSQDSINRVDLGIKGTTKWHLQNTHFVVDEREPAFMSGSATQILDYLKMQEADMYDGFFQQNEEWAWTLPAANNDGSVYDPLPLGFPYWLVQSPTAAFGFNGGTPLNYSDVAGVDTTMYPEFKNGTFTYNSIANGDFLKKCSEALNKCDFETPHPNDGENTPERKYGMSSSFTPWHDYQDVLYASNDNIGSDAGKYRGIPTNTVGMQYFMGVPWSWVAALGDPNSPAYDSNDPVYGINWDTFLVKTYGDLFMDRKEPIRLDQAHNTIVTWMDTGYQICCRSRRQNFVARRA